MMGSGKSYWMNYLSKQLGIPGYDLDELISSSLEKSISDIFLEFGESHFRDAETALLNYFSDKDSFVLSTGGGTPCFNNNMQWMNEHGTTVWIDEPVDVLVKRLIPEKYKRPLVKHLSDARLKDFLISKLEERRPFYSQAKLQLAAPVTENSFTVITRASNLN